MVMVGVLAASKSCYPDNSDCLSSSRQILETRLREMKLLILGSEALVVLVLLLNRWNLADSYDPMDPDGNITVTIDILSWKDDNSYMARATIQNYYQYRHIGKPGWGLGWTWAGKEIILSMAGAVATQQGDCSEFKSLPSVPYSCKRDPVIVDRTPDAAGENWTSNCCHGGILSAWGIDQPRSFSSFDMHIGNLNGNSSVSPPINLTLLAPGLGYTCSQLEEVPPTVFKVDGGKREEQVFRTWKSACTYSPFVANNTPTCCVSLSAFYNPEITPCPVCSCSCQDKTCAGGKEAKLSTVGTWQNSDSDNMVRCTDHMCPVQVHWHVKANYRDKWRVKVTVSNYRFGYNYSDWNLEVQHPGLGKLFRTYSFNSTKLTTVGNMDDAAIFWGLEYYNTELPQSGDEGPSFVTSDFLINKDDSFTLNNGGAFPRRIDFNGDLCKMPMPDHFPRLPNASSPPLGACYFLLFILSIVLLNH